MEARQLTLLQYATELLEAQANQLEPISYPTSVVARRLGISSSVLNRAKNTGKLPYICQWEDGEVFVYFSHREKGKDFWKVFHKVRR
jgi:hypothetical protein